MRVVVLGSGVIGVASAYYLAEAGHEVVVLDRQDGAALETSFANAGEVSPGYSSPWAAPGLPIKALQWLFMRHRPLVIWPMPDLRMIEWGLRLLMNCTSARYELNKGRMVPIAEYSRDLLRDLRQRAGITYDERALGTLQLFRKQEQLDGTAKDIAILEKFGVPYEVLDVAGCVAVEPALRHVKEKVAGGLRLPGDETGDCFKFTNALAALCRQLGVEFRYRTTIEGILAGRSRASWPKAARSPAWSPAAARSRAMPTSWRWAATRPGCCARSASARPCTRSRATRSPCRSPILRVRPNRR
jgi:D-amino-acid dehydrogenase